MRNLRLAILVGLASLALLIVTEPGMSIVWDEGYTLGRVERVRLWLKAIYDPPKFSANWSPPELELVQAQGLPAPNARQVSSRWSLFFEPRVVGWFWPFAREEPHGHPPFYALVALIGDLVTPWREPLARARFGTILFHSIACASLFHVLKKRFGILAAISSSICWTASPQLFGLAHYATYDGLLSSLWLMGLLATAEANDAVGRKQAIRRFALSGLIFGAAMSTKLSGWFLIGPMVFGAMIGGPWKRQFKGLLLSLCIATVSLYLFNPSWWCEPVGGPLRFFKSNLTRGRTIPIETLYLGQVYKTPLESLPWSNTLVWTILATPVIALIASLVGLIPSSRRGPQRTFTQILAVGWFIPLALRALPHTPGHDGVRQFIAGLGVGTAMTGIGIGWIYLRKPLLAKGLTGFLIAEVLMSLAHYYPAPLSYFSPMVGGLPGAARLGMEPTYYWDGLTPDALDWLNANTDASERLAFRGFPTSFFYLHQVGKLKPLVDPRTAGPFRWLVMQNRPGNFEERDHEVVRKLKPAYTYIKYGVWLVSIYDMNEVQTVWSETLSKPNRKQP